MAGDDEARPRVGQIQSHHATAACRAAQMSLGCIMAANTIKDTAPVNENSRPSEQTNAASTGPSWRLVRSTGPNGEPGASAILHTIDFERSDPRLAGLMLQCGKQNIEIIIVVVEPFPPRARPQVTLRTSGQVFQFEGSIISTGAGILLPSDATVSLLGPWRSASELEIKVADRETVLDGVVPLELAREI